MWSVETHSTGYGHTKFQCYRKTGFASLILLFVKFHKFCFVSVALGVAVELYLYTFISEKIKTLRHYYVITIYEQTIHIISIVAPGDARGTVSFPCSFSKA